MKWLSIKKYLPPACSVVFIRAVNGNEYDRYFVGFIEDFTKIDDLEAWEMANGFQLIDIDPDDYKVTHFALIDGIEIE